MGKIAFLFAGQGAQAPGMGQSLQQNSPKAAGLFELFDSIRPGTSAQCFTGTPEELAQTENTQPCVFAVGLAAAAALAEKGVLPQGVAGFSLGEMAALTFAKSFTLQNGFTLVGQRAGLMQQANIQNPGVMAAVLKLQDTAVEEICANFKQMYPVNYNCDGQLVVAGSSAEMPEFCAAVKEAGGLAKPLAVGGGFHSPFMQQASDEFLQAIKGSEFAAPTLPVYANLTALPYTLEDLPLTLAKQMCRPVLWKQTLQNMWNDGFTTFIEVGPGKTLTGLAKRVLPEATLFTVQDIDGVQAAASALQP